jgi:pimeloyl-ACP methyl ester carboxylesterase
VNDCVESEPIATASGSNTVHLLGVLKDHPPLLVVGEESWMVVPTEQIASANPQFRIVHIPQAGHWIPLDNPRGFLEVVGAFLTGHE